MLVPSNTPSGLLWVGVAKAVLFRGFLHINAARVLVVEHLMGRQQLFLELLYRYAQCAYLMYLSFSLEDFGRLYLLLNHSSFTSALASWGQNCPWHGFLGCHDHHCLFYIWLWPSGPIRKMDVYHWLYDPTASERKIIQNKSISHYHK